jgi:hypothetical protein
MHTHRVVCFEMRCRQHCQNVPPFQELELLIWLALAPAFVVSDGMDTNTVSVFDLELWTRAETTCPNKEIVLGRQREVRFKCEAKYRG